MGTDVEARLARELPAYARRVLGALEGAGYEAWVVGCATRFSAGRDMTWT